MTKIVRAAIRHKGAVYSVPIPGRHHDCLLRMAVDGAHCGDPYDQGFLTDHGEFVDRRTAKFIAESQQQIREKTGPADILFSEDLW